MGFHCDGKTEMSVTRREAGNPQHPKRVFDKVRGDVSQDLGFKVGLAPIGVDDHAVAIAWHTPHLRQWAWLILLWLAGYKLIPASVAAILNETSTSFIVLLAWLVLGESINQRKLMGLLLTVAGVMLMLLK